MECEPSVDLTPSITIQCDWENYIGIPHKQFWVSCKFLGQTSIHANLRGVTAESDSTDFTATVGANSLCVRYNPTNHLCRFIPPYKVFQQIHKKSVLAVDAANGGLGVSVGGDNRLVVWDNATGEVRKELTGHAGDIYKCKLFPSGIVILSGGADMKLKIWSAETGQCAVSLIGHKAAVADICFVERGRNVISVSKDGTAKIWDCGQASCLATILEATAWLNCCSIGPGPEEMLRGVVTNNREIGTEDKILLVGGEDGIINGIAIAARASFFTISTGSAVNAILYFSDDLFVAGTQDGRLLLYSLHDGSLVRCIHESNSAILSIALFKDKGVLIGRYDGTVTYYGLQSQTSDRIQLTGSDCEPVHSIAVTNSSVYAGCRDGNIRKYKTTDLLAGGV